MDVSFILSSDELYTLISLIPDATSDGQGFVKEALVGAVICDLSGLVNKKLANHIEEEIDIEPVVRMVISAIAKANSVKHNEGVWTIKSSWIALICEKYFYNDNHWKITPLKEIKSK
jgi:hypothetical protein